MTQGMDGVAILADQTGPSSLTSPRILSERERQCRPLRVEFGPNLWVMWRSSARFRPTLIVLTVRLV